MSRLPEASPSHAEKACAEFLDGVEERQHGAIMAAAPTHFAGLFTGARPPVAAIQPDTTPGDHIFMPDVTWDIPPSMLRPDRQATRDPIPYFAAGQVWRTAGQQTRRISRLDADGTIFTEGFPDVTDPHPRMHKPDGQHLLTASLDLVELIKDAPKYETGLLGWCLAVTVVLSLGFLALQDFGVLR